MHKLLLLLSYFVSILVCSDATSFPYQSRRVSTSEGRGLGQTSSNSSRVSIEGKLSLSDTLLKLGPVLPGEIRKLSITLSNTGEDSLLLVRAEHSANIRTVDIKLNISQSPTLVTIVLVTPLSSGDRLDSVIFLADGEPSSQVLVISYSVMGSLKQRTRKEISLPGSTPKVSYIKHLSATDTQITVVAVEAIKDGVTRCLGFDKSLNKIWEQHELAPDLSAYGLFSYGKSSVLVSVGDVVRHKSFGLDGSFRTISSINAFYPFVFPKSSLSGRYILSFGATRPAKSDAAPFTYDRGDAIVQVFDIEFEKSSLFIHRGPSNYQSWSVDTNGLDKAYDACVRSNGELVAIGLEDRYIGPAQNSYEILRPFIYSEPGPVQSRTPPHFSFPLFVDFSDRLITRGFKSLLIIDHNGQVIDSSALPFGVNTILPCKNGDLFVYASNSKEAHVLRLSKDLKILWSRHAVTGNLTRYKVQLDSAENFYGAFFDQSLGGKGTVTFVRYSPEGELQWLERIGDTTIQYFLNDMCVSPDGVVVFGGPRYVGPDSVQEVLISFAEPHQTSKVYKRSSKNTSFTVTPNPVRHEAVIYSDEETFSFDVIDLLGRKRQHSSDDRINASGLESGMYFAKVTTSKNQIIFVPFLKH